MEFRFELPAKFGVGKSKLGVPEYIYPEIKGRWFNYIFFTFEVAKLIFLTCHIQNGTVHIGVLILLF